MCHTDAVLPRNYIRDFWSEDSWDESKIRRILLPLGVPNAVVEKIMDTPIDAAGKDVVRWSSTPHGNFSTSSAWESIRHRKERMESFRLIWNPAISHSMSIFVWRLLANRIPVDEKLQWRNIHLASKCRCCKNPRSETREHLFLKGEAAGQIWRYFANWFPNVPAFPDGMADMEQLLRWWHSNMGQGAKDHVNILIPCLILWHIWIERNSVIHRGATFRSGMVIDRILQYLQWAISARKSNAKQWKGLSPTVTFKFPHSSVNRAPPSQVVRWELPQQGWLKLNTCGTFVRTSSLAGGGGVIRDEQGRILRGFAELFSAGSGVEAEMKALLRGIELAGSLGENIWIEVNAQEMVGLIVTGNRGAAEVRHVLTKIRNTLRRCHFKITHIPREGNSVADFLAKEGWRQEQRFTFDQESAPPFVRALARMDRLGIPNVRHPDRESEEET